MVGIVSLALITILVDQLSKHLIVSSLFLGESMSIIPHVFHITRVHNTGVAFGLFRDNGILSLVFVIVGIVLLIIILYNMRTFSRLGRIACAFIVGGAVGNIIDRIRFGYVIDFIDLQIWPVFNIADTCISVAAGLLLISLLLNRS